MCGVQFVGVGGVRLVAGASREGHPERTEGSGPEKRDGPNNEDDARFVQPRAAQKKKASLKISLKNLLDCLLTQNKGHVKRSHFDLFQCHPTVNKMTIAGVQLGFFLA